MKYNQKIKLPILLFTRVIKLKFKTGDAKRKSDSCEKKVIITAKNRHLKRLSLQKLV